MVTPADADDFDPQAFLVGAEPSYFYMDEATRDQVAAVDGVEAASAPAFPGHRPRLVLFGTLPGHCIRPGDGLHHPAVDL